MSRRNRVIMGSVIGLGALAVTLDHTRHRLPAAIEGAANPCAAGSEPANPCSLGDDLVNPCSLGDDAVNPCSLGDDLVNPCSL